VVRRTCCRSRCGLLRYDIIDHPLKVIRGSVQCLYERLPGCSLTTVPSFPPQHTPNSPLVLIKMATSTSLHPYFLSPHLAAARHTFGDGDTKFPHPPSSPPELPFNFFDHALNCVFLDFLNFNSPFPFTIRH